MAGDPVIHDKSWLCERVFSSNNHNHEQPSASPASIQCLLQAAKCRGQSKVPIRLISSLTCPPGRVTKYHSPSPVAPQVAYCQAQESPFHLSIMNITPCLQAFITSMPLNPNIILRFLFLTTSSLQTLTANANFMQPS